MSTGIVMEQGLFECVVEYWDCYGKHSVSVTTQRLENILFSVTTENRMFTALVTENMIC